MNNIFLIFLLWTAGLLTMAVYRLIDGDTSGAIMLMSASIVTWGITVWESPYNVDQSEYTCTADKEGKKDDKA